MKGEGELALSLTLLTSYLKIVVVGITLSSKSNSMLIRYYNTYFTTIKNNINNITIIILIS